MTLLPTTRRHADPAPPRSPVDDNTNLNISQRAFRGGLWQSAAQVAPYLYTTVVSVIAARILGPERMGRQSFIAFVVVVTQSICIGGLNTALLRFIGNLRGAGRTGALPSLATLAWRVSATTGAIGTLVVIGAAAAGADPTLAWLFAAGAVLAGTLGSVPGAVLIGGQQWRKYSLISIATGGASVVATLVVLVVGWGVSGMLGVIAVSAAARLAWMGRTSHRFLAPLRARRETLAETRRDVLLFALASTVPVILGLVVFQRSELFFLERFSSDTQIALYSIAFSATAALNAIPAAISSVLTPSVATLVGSADYDRVSRGYSRVLRLSLLFALPLTAASIALGPTLLRLVYGSRYASSGDIFLIVAATIPFVPLSGASAAVLTGFGRVRVPIAITMVAAAIDIALAAALVPVLDATGAAVANTCAFLVMAFLMIAAVSRVVGRVEIGRRSVIRIGIVSAAAAGAARLVLVAGETPALWILAVAVDVVVLALSAALFRVVPAADGAFLAQVAGTRGRLGRLVTRASERAIEAD